MRSRFTSRTARARLGCPTSIASALFAAIVGSGCSAAIDTSLEDKSCSAERECLPGWVCSRETNKCVQSEDTGSSSNRATGSTESGASGDKSGPRVATQDGTRKADGGVDATVADVDCDASMSCEGRCVDVSIDPRNCGTCGHQCEQPLHGQAVCIDGKCDIACEPETALCDRQCVRLNEDPSHCGSCNNSCATPFGGRGVCADNTCHIECNPGLMQCGDTCVWQLVDAANCGECGRACPPDESCGGGVCMKMCTDPSTQCDRSCVDLTSDPIHCGACGNACDAPENQVGVCLDGKCETQCAPGRTSCDGNCVDLQNDALNCGACGGVCPEPPRATPFCNMGSCDIACEAGYEPCDGQCVSDSIVETARNAGFGELGVCAALAALQAGMCLQSQDARWCDRGCVNTRTDESHCGYCYRACEAGETCWGGRCL